ncbi:MAG: cobalt-precorrin-4 C(11)-methyltransferase, partial [Schwartzia sp.]|nr:cobalt-precorrin-4 C(11)-methyltransferase [Schwartzia sp. (in: firmicutes)]
MQKVSIVGAGPGDPELITVKGQRLLKEADVVIYAGSLVNPRILEVCRKNAEIFNSASNSNSLTYSTLSTNASKVPFPIFQLSTPASSK